MKAKAEAVSQQLATVIQAGDSSNIPKEIWFEIIRRNWPSIEWRMQQADARGDVKFIRDALEAHGLNPSLLNLNADVITQGLSHWNVDANGDFAKWMATYAKEHGVINIPEEAES